MLISQNEKNNVNMTLIPNVRTSCINDFSIIKQSNWECFSLVIVVFEHQKVDA